MKRGMYSQGRVDKSRGMATVIAEALAKNESKRAPQVSQTGRAKKMKLIRFLGQFSGQNTSLTMSMQEKEAQKIIV
jgi:hypothetical protein